MLCMSLESHLLILNGDIDFILLYIIIIQMKQQITENEENLFFGGKCLGVGSDIKSGWSFVSILGATGYDFKLILNFFL